MNNKYKIYEIYDTACAFITDAHTTLIIENNTTNKIFYITKQTVQGNKYTLKITHPTSKAVKQYGKIFFQENNNVPVLISQTQYKTSNLFSKILLYKYFDLIKKLEQRQNNNLSLTDNTIQIFNTIMRFNQTQR